MCLHKNPATVSQMSRAPVNEQNSGVAAVSTSVRFREWRGLNGHLQDDGQRTARAERVFFPRQNKRQQSGN